MNELFSQILNMSLTASVVIVCVIAVRLVLKKAPKIFSYALWSVVLFRLLCPVSLPSPVSLLELAKPQVTESAGVTSTVSYRPVESISTNFQENRQSEPQAAAPRQTVTKTENPDTPVSLMTIAAYVWVVGTGGMVLYSAVVYLRLRRRLAGATPLKGNIYLADHIGSPFVMGILWPRIYLPSALSMQERRYIVAHERHHICRGDHFVKLLAYAALCIHWFNPLVWAAFILAGKDMEMSCDEAVIRKLGVHIRADYSASLLRLSTGRRIISGTPLAFGEGDTKGRILNMAKWKKPKVWVCIVCIVVCAAVLAACAVNPEKNSTTQDSSMADSSPTEHSYMAEQPETQTAGVPDFPFQIEQLPEGYSYERDENGTVIFTDGTNTVGGIVYYPIPERVSDVYTWLKDEVIADYKDSSLGYMSGSSTFYNSWNVEFFSDVPEGEEQTVKRSHTFCVVGDGVYDIWIDQLLVDYKAEEEFFRGIKLAGAEEADPAVVEEQQNAEEMAFKKCSAVVEAVQSGSYHTITEYQYSAENAFQNFSFDFYSSHEDWLRIIYNSLSERHAALYANGHSFTNIGSWAADELIWTEGAVSDTFMPWLASFRFSEDSLTYIDTLTDADGECIMYRIDAYFEDAEDYAPCYFANFYFDPDGNFMKVQMEVNIFQDNAITVTESIVSLDPETVVAEINKEYHSAIGE